MDSGAAAGLILVLWALLFASLPPVVAPRIPRFSDFLLSGCRAGYNPRRAPGRQTADSPVAVKGAHVATSFGALCTDFYINLKLALKMDLPADRETILHLLDRVRKSEPSMDNFHRYDNELVLESSRREAEYRWLSLERNSVRSGHVNPQEMAEAYKYHKLIIDLAPHFLSISPLDVDYIELTFGFDFECKANHDEVVFEALYADSPMAGLIKGSAHSQPKLLDVQPVLGMTLGKNADVHAFFEVKTRTRGRKGGAGRYRNEPLSIFLSLRQFGPVGNLEDLPNTFERLRTLAEILTTQRLVPHLLQPIARQITSSSAGGEPA